MASQKPPKIPKCPGPGPLGGPQPGGPPGPPGPITLAGSPRTRVCRHEHRRTVRQSTKALSPSQGNPLLSKYNTAMK
ncbi:hypothetical protein U1Q18_015326 [Sarracenia purpurea var. burkii]